MMNQDMPGEEEAEGSAMEMMQQCKQMLQEAMSMMDRAMAKMDQPRQDMQKGFAKARPMGGM